jgi:dihydropyrimidinase
MILFNTGKNHIMGVSMDLIVKSGKAVLPDRIVKADIGISAGKIVAIKNKLTGRSAETIDASGMLVLPGVIDAHVHFQLQAGKHLTCENFESGTRAAACGGVTTVIDFAIQEKGKSLLQAIEDRRKIAGPQAAIDYALHAVPTDWNETTRREITEIARAGVTTFKMYMVYEGLQAGDKALFECLEETAKAGAMVTAHAESAEILAMMIERYHTESEMKKHGAYCHALSRPDFVEAEAISRAVTWAKATNGRLYIVHLSSAAGLKIIRQARKEGAKVFAETCPHYLYFDDDIFRQNDGYLYATCPQVKKKLDREHLWDGIKRGDIQIVATDNCAFNLAQKSSWDGDFTKIPYGLPGVETLLPIIYTIGVKKNKITLRKMVELIISNPAKLMGLYPQKGVIKSGSDADLVLIDPHKRTTISYSNIHSNCDWSPYEGLKLYGVPSMTISRGRIVAANGKFAGQAGWGKFVPRGKAGFPR